MIRSIAFSVSLTLYYQCRSNDLNNPDDLTYWNVRKSMRYPRVENLDEFVEEQSLALSK